MQVNHYLKQKSHHSEGKDITFNEAELLREEIIQILLKGIEAGGSTLKDHRKN